MSQLPEDLLASPHFSQGPLQTDSPSSDGAATSRLQHLSRTILTTRQTTFMFPTATSLRSSWSCDFAKHKSNVPFHQPSTFASQWLEEDDHALQRRGEKTRAGEGKPTENLHLSLPAAACNGRRKHSIFCQFIFHCIGVTTSHERPEIITVKACLPGHHKPQQLTERGAKAIKTRADVL